MVVNRSLRDIYDEYKNLVYNLSLQYVHNTEDAQDITQEVFVKVHQSLHTFDERSSTFKTWIYRITINQNLDFLKAKGAKKRFSFVISLFGSDSDETPLDPGHFNHPGVQLEDKESVEFLFSLIDQLPEHQRTAIILMKIEGRTQAETGEIMKLSPKAVESLVQRAKQTLSKMIDRRKSKE